MANELLNTIKAIGDYVDGLDAAVTKFIDVIPLLVKQHIGQAAKSKLETTYDNYMGALTSKVEQNVLIVELDPDNFMANAVENGMSALDLKIGLLNSPKAKVGKNGAKYIVVPIGKTKHGTGGSTDKGKELQRKIQEVLIKPKLGASKLTTKIGGGVYETQKIITDEPQLQGFYRSREFNSVGEYFESKKKPKWNLVLFRVVSENSPKDSFLHPGITPRSLLPEAECWLDNTAGDLLDSFIRAEMDARKL